MGIYTFDKDDAYRFADSVRGKKTVRGNELVFQFCPYCSGGKSHDTSTFSINLTNGQFQCKRSSCSVHGNMITLSRDFGFSINSDVDKYINLNSYNDRYKKFREAHIESKPTAIQYLLSRGISEEITKKYEITTRKDNDDILVFPFKDENGTLTFIKYRNIKYVKGVTSGHKEFCEPNCKPILFGMNHCVDRERLVITEGQIDSLSVAECGIANAVSVPIGMNGFTWIPYCWDFVSGFKEIVVFGDCENGKVTLADMIASRFPKITKIVRAEDYKGYKDANEILRNLGKEAIISAINNAEGQTSGSIKDMADVRAVDISKIPKIRTNVPELNELLGGGFHYGQVILQSGERGNGKSTWASQTIIDALDQGVNAFMYSGELPDFFVKNWLDRQIIGKEFLTQTETETCEKWYRGRLFIYDDSAIKEDDTETLLDTIEEVIRIKAVKYVLIDNLMTALDCDSNEALYRSQSNFIGSLAKLSKQYEVVIMIVAHPRKKAVGQTSFTSDDVSGSADITNRVDVVMSYDRVYDSKGEEIDPNQRKMTVTKNRLTGKLTSARNEILLYYNDDSKRVVGRDKNFSYRYVDKDKDGFASVSDIDLEQMNIPF